MPRGLSRSRCERSARTSSATVAKRPPIVSQGKDVGGPTRAELAGQQGTPALSIHGAAPTSVPVAARRAPARRARSRRASTSAAPSGAPPVGKAGARPLPAAVVDASLDVQPARLQAKGMARRGSRGRRARRPPSAVSPGREIRPQQRAPPPPRRAARPARRRSPGSRPPRARCAGRAPAVPGARPARRLRSGRRRPSASRLSHLEPGE